MATLKIGPVLSEIYRQFPGGHWTKFTEEGLLRLIIMKLFKIIIIKFKFAEKMSSLVEDNTIKHDDWRRIAEQLRWRKYMSTKVDDRPTIMEGFRPSLVTYKIELEKYGECDVNLDKVAEIWSHFGSNAGQYWKKTPDSGPDANKVDEVAATFYKSVLGQEELAANRQ